MFRNPNHVTIAVAEAINTISSSSCSASESNTWRRSMAVPRRCMGMPHMKAEHITLQLEGSAPPFEIQLLEFDPVPTEDPGEHPTNRSATWIQPPCASC